MSIEVNPDEDFHVVINGNVLALSLDALSAAYEGEVIQDESLIWQPGLGEWMRLDTVLYHLEQQDEAVAAAPAPEPDPDTFYVQVAEDEVKQMSLDQLDTAYRVDIIDLSTLVWQPGYTEWIPLAVLLGDPPEEDHYSLAPSMPAPLPGVGISPTPRRPAPAPSAPPSPQSQAPSYAPKPASFAPPAASAQSTLPPISAPSTAPNSLSAVSNSYIPQIPAPAPKASPWYARTLVAAAALSAIGVAHRHGAGYELAGAIDGDSSEKVWAARLGEPSPATPYGLERWLGEVEDKYALNELSETSPVVNDSISQPSSPPPSTASSSDAPDADEAGDQDQAKTDTSTQARSCSKPASNTADAFGAALGNKKAPQPARKSAPARTYKPANKKSSGPLKTGHAFDPMNGAL